MGRSDSSPALGNESMAAISSFGLKIKSSNSERPLINLKQEDVYKPPLMGNSATLIAAHSSRQSESDHLSALSRLCWAWARESRRITERSVFAAVGDSISAPLQVAHRRARIGNYWWHSEKSRPNSIRTMGRTKMLSYVYCYSQPFNFSKRFNLAGNTKPSMEFWV